MEPSLEFISKENNLLMNYSEHRFEQCFCTQRLFRVIKSVIKEETGSNTVVICNCINILHIRKR
jgi:hypothetical protein